MASEYQLTIEDDDNWSLTLSDQGVAIPSTHASTHGSAGSDPITIANTQVTGLGTMSTQAASAVAITGGSITDADIYAPDMSDGTWEGGALTNATINSTTIGGTTPAAGTFTAVAGTTGTFSGAVSGTTGTFSGNTSVGGTLTVTGAVTLTTDLTVPNGGTGASTLTGMVRGNGASAFTAVTTSTVGQALRCTGANNFAFGAVDLANANAVTGTLPVARGGTGGASAAAARTALDVPATNNTIRWRPDITAFNGGASNALDSIDISNVTTWPTGAGIAFSVSGDLVVYRLTATGAAESSPTIIRPDSYGGREWTLVSLLESNVSITGGTITGITDLAVADGGTGASTAPAARTNLGLGTSAVQDANNVAITGGSITGITDLAIADGGTGASTAAEAVTALGFVSGTGTLNGLSAVTVSIPGATSSSKIVVCARTTGVFPNGVLYGIPDTDELKVASTESTDVNEFTYFGIL